MATTIRLEANESHFPILSLPQEILSSILDLVINADSLNSGDEFNNRPKATAWLSETCQQFRDTVTPKLYSELHLVPNIVDEDNQVVPVDLYDKGRISTSRLHRTLIANPHLGTHCKTLKVCLDQTNILCIPTRQFILSEATFDFVSLLGNTTSLSIDGFQPRPCNAHSKSVFRFVCTAVKNLPKLKTLSLLGRNLLPAFLVDVMCYITRSSTSLSVLEFGQIGPAGTSLCRRRLKEVEGTGPITSLIMDEFRHAPKALEAIVRWPRNLEKLSIFPRILCHSYRVHQAFSKQSDFAAVQPILETQMANLRELSILPLYHGRGQMVRDIENLNLTGFTKLEVLTLPYFQTGYDSRHIPQILAPNLRVFNWLGPFYSSTENWVIPEEWVMPDDGVSSDVRWIPEHWEAPEPGVEDFGQKQEDWVRAMVDFAAKKQQKLREIYIAFKDAERKPGVGESCVVDACERLEKIARDSEEFGIKIRYDKAATEKV